MYLTILRYTAPYLVAILFGIYIGAQWFGCDVKKDSELPANLINGTNTITRVIHEANDTCATKRMPDSVIVQLR